MYKFDKTEWYKVQGSVLEKECTCMPTRKHLGALMNVLHKKGRWITFRFGQ